MTEPLRVLFVCTANICRSAYATVRSEQLLGTDAPVRVSSAGTHGWVDQPMDPPMAAEVHARHGDPSGFRSRRLTPEIIRDADVILAAGSQHRDFILDEWPEVFRRTFTLQQFADLAAAAPDLDPRGLLAEAHRLRKPTHPSDDVPDPYGRGAKAAAQCATHLDRLLAGILPRLAGSGGQPA